MKTFTACILIGGAFVLGAALDGNNQLDELNDALNLSDSKKAAQRVYKKELAAARLCREQVGVSTVQWTASGELVCIPAKKESSK